MGGDSLSVPILYEANATDFNNLGLGPLVDTTVATVTEERNGQFILEMQYPVEGIRSSLITKNRILKVDAGHKLKDQRFVIKRINRIMGNDGLSYSIYAEHISYITADYALKPNLTISGSGNVAMTQWLNGIIDSNRIHVDSDVTTENTTSWTIDKVQNARQALGGVQGSILDVWGGEYRFDNLNISLLRHRGTVSNTMLSYGRNITDFDQEENITNTYTSIYPFASYSVQNGDTSEQKILTIPDLVVDSEYVNNFPNRKIQVVDFSDKFSTDEKPTVERLAELAKSYIKNNNVGVPTVSTKISFVDLSKTENYKEFAPLEELDLCDEVPFAFEKFGIKTTAKISRIVWNVLLDSYDSLELGELKTNLSDVINNTNNAALDAKDAANDAKNSADNAALSANGKNRNWYGADDPDFGHLSELREGDSWYKPNGEDTELYYWENGQWVFILSTKDTHEAKDAADTAQKEAEEAKTQANKAVDGANDAVAKAGFATDTATQAKSDAAAAGQQAKDALTNAGTALTNAKNALDNVNKLDQTVKTEVTNINGQLAQKVNQITFDTLKGTVTSQGTIINQNKAEIQLKADLSLVNTIKQTVTNNTAAIDLNSKEIKLKASQSDVDKLGGRVTDAEAQIKLQADQIKLTVSKTELTSKLNDYATQTWTQSQIKSTADQINLSVAQIKTDVENNDTENLIPNSSFKLGKTGWSGWETPYIHDSVVETYHSKQYTAVYFGQNKQPYVDLIHDGKIPMKPNTPYVFQIKTRSLIKNHPVTYIQEYDAAGKVINDHAFILNVNSPDYINNVQKFTTSATAEYGVLRIRAQPGDQFMASELMLTEGTIAPKNWYPSSVDNATTADFANLEITIKGIQTTVSGKADQSQVTQLAGQITSVVSTANGNSSQITQLSKDINLRVTADQVDASILADKTIKDTRDDNQPPSWYYANYPSQIVREFKHSNKIGISDSIFAILETNVPWRNPSGGQINQMARTDKHTWQRFSTSESAWGAWAIVADTSNVISQINISPESILIAGQKVHITGQTSIDNAVIKDAMIADVKADKITAGTLNAANVNVINLNANNITTGTIKGANLSMNLNTGEVVFQKGRIHSASNNIDVNIDQGYLSTASNDTRAMLKEGQLQLVQPTIFDNSKDPYLQISNSIGGASFNGANIIARDYLVLANRANSDGFFNAPLDGPETFAGLAVGKTSADRWKPTRIGGAERGIIMRGGTAYKIDSSFMYKSSPEIFVGTDEAGLNPSDRIYINGSYVHIKSAYWRTASGSANLMVAQDGALVRSTSASKYKTDIVRTNKSDYGDKLLNLPTATWTDIAETKRYQDNPTTQAKPTRNFGMIAEDLADAGLEMLVVRGKDGELEGINYDRIGPALIPVIAKLKNEVETLKQQLEGKTA